MIASVEDEDQWLRAEAGHALGNLRAQQAEGPLREALAIEKDSHAVDDFEYALEKIAMAALASYLATGPGDEWAQIAVEAGFREAPDDSKQVNKEDLQDLRAVLELVDVTGPRELDRLLGNARSWGRSALAQVARESGDRDYTPYAFAADVIAIVALLANPQQNLEGATPFREELDSALATVAPQLRTHYEIDVKRPDATSQTAQQVRMIQTRPPAHKHPGTCLA